jgi:hypothetical protein
MDLHLRDGERMKIARPRGGTKHCPTIVPPDDVISEILNSNQAFIPIEVGPFGSFGFDNVTTLPLPTFSVDQPNASRAAKLATNHRTPYKVLGRADKKWRATNTNPSKCFDGSFLSQLPSTWAHQ